MVSSFFYKYILCSKYFQHDGANTKFRKLGIVKFHKDRIIETVVYDVSFMDILNVGYFDRLSHEKFCNITRIIMESKQSVKFLTQIITYLYEHNEQNIKWKDVFEFISLLAYENTRKIPDNYKLRIFRSEYDDNKKQTIEKEEIYIKE